MLRVFEAFAGYGSQSIALRNLGIEYEVVAISEIDKYAIKAYEAIHESTNNLGDISKIKVEDIPDHNLFTYSFPCQDISVAGKTKGIVKGETRSGLLYECERIIEAKRPKYLLLENVKNLVGKKFKAQFEEWLAYLEGLGYTNYWQVLNAKHYGVPQNRERVFVVSILGEHKPYKFPEPMPLDKCIKDILEDKVEEKYYLSEEIQNRFKITNQSKNIIGTTKPDYRTIGQRDLVYNKEGIMGALVAIDYKQPKQIAEINQLGMLDIRGNEQVRRVYGANGISPTLNTMQGGNRQPKILIPQATKKGYIEMDLPGVCDLSYPNSKTRRGRVQEGGKVSPTLTAANQDICYIERTYRIRKLTPRECFRLMGMSDDDIDKIQTAGISNTQQYKMAGNSIVVDVLEAIFKNLFMEG